jgi:hypothetical protein
VLPRSAAALDDALARALDLATEQRDITLVRRILDQIERRERADAGNVTALDTKRGTWSR